MITGMLIGSEHLTPFLRNITASTQVELEKSITVLTLKLLRNVKESKLSGQVLKNRTGTLRRSINQRVDTTSTGVTGTVGTNKSYAAVHEYGFDGQVTVRAHMRQIKQAFGVALKTPKEIQVNSFSRHMRMPERSFLRSALREMDNEIKTEISAALKRALS